MPYTTTIEGFREEMERCFGSEPANFTVTAQALVWRKPGSASGAAVTFSVADHKVKIAGTVSDQRQLLQAMTFLSHPSASVSRTAAPSAVFAPPSAAPPVTQEPNPVATAPENTLGQRVVRTAFADATGSASVLMLQEGDLVTVLQDDDPQGGPDRWVLGINESSCAGLQGYFPLSYTKPVA